MFAERRIESHHPRQFEFEFHALERERRRVAKELHDEILPSLARLIRSIESQSENYSDLVLALHNLVESFRDVLGELHPVDLEELGLEPALHNLSMRYGRLTGRSIHFNEKSEECHLNAFQQLLIYRAMQAVLRMFATTGNDTLMVAYDQRSDETFVTLHCVDKIVAAQEWLSAGTPDFDAFEALCALAGATFEVNSIAEQSKFPFDLLLKIPAQSADTSHTRPRHAELLANRAVEAERLRICDEINSRILPHLHRCNAFAAAADNVLLSMAVHDRLQLVTAGVKAVMGEAHRQVLEQTGLVPSIMTLVDRFTKASLIETTIAADLSSADVNISSEAKFAVYRVTQEALNNVEKHSKATLARISIKRDVHALVVEIEDNGNGFEQPVPTQSRGLKIIRERAETIGAEVSWQPAASFDTGTLVRISLPY